MGDRAINLTIGLIAAARRTAAGATLRIRAPLPGPALAIGESISVQGVCLTVTRRGRGWFEAECSPGTLRVTTLGKATTGGRVNLERALLPTTRMGGHLVQGHVDGTGVVATGG